MLWGASPLDLLLGCSVNLGRYTSENIFTGAAAFVMSAGKEMLQRGPSGKGADHGRLAVPCKDLYRPPRCEHQPCRC